MGNEVEIKIRIDDVDEAVERVEALGAAIASTIWRATPSITRTSSCDCGWSTDAGSSP